MAEAWFKPKSYGYGASPANWKGWAATAGFVAVILMLTFWMVIWPERDGTLTTGGILLWLALDIALTFGFVWLARVKSDGPWRWQWGARDG